MAINDKKLADLKSGVTLIGGGKMGSALLTGWLDAGIPPSLVQIVDPNPSAALRAISTHWSVPIETTLEKLGSGVIVLAVKPQIIDAVTKAVAPIVNGTCIVLYRTG